MQTLKGIAVSPGIALGEAMVIDNEGFHVQYSRIKSEDLIRETERLESAFQIAKQELTKNRDAVNRELGEQYGAIFQAHLALLEDNTIRTEIAGLLNNNLYSPEYAVHVVLKKYAEMIGQLANGYVAQRANDILDLENRLMRILMGIHPQSLSNLTKEVVILAHNLTPSETTNLNRKAVKGFVTEIGAMGSHTAIVAEALEIPAIVGLGKFLPLLQSGQQVIVDGDTGTLIIDPDEETLRRYRVQLELRHSEKSELSRLDGESAITKDGTRVLLHGNIEFEEEAEHCFDRNADGIGLYRTEFLYMTGALNLDEQAHYQSYKKVIQAMRGKPVTIRTFDMGSDKIQTDLMPDVEKNPALGLRSIRLALYVPELFRKQLRAILRASVLGPVRLLFPMIATLPEWRKVKMILNDTFEDLDERGIPYDHDIKTGIMVEVPATVMMIDRFMKDIDFLSIGTNDLIQYTLAADRTNKDVAALFNAADPAIIRLLKTILNAAAAAAKPVSLCGQMGSDPLYTMLLLGLGLRSISVPPMSINAIKQMVRAVTIEECQQLVERTFDMDSAADIKSLLQIEMQKKLPHIKQLGD